MKTYILNQGIYYIKKYIRLTGSVHSSISLSLLALATSFTGFLSNSFWQRLIMSFLKVYEHSCLSEFLSEPETSITASSLHISAYATEKLGSSTA